MATVGLDLSTTLSTRRPFASVRSRNFSCGIFVWAFVPMACITNIRKAIRLSRKRLRILQSSYVGWLWHAHLARDHGQDARATLENSIQIQRIPVNLGVFF